MAMPKPLRGDGRGAPVTDDQRHKIVLDSLAADSERALNHFYSARLDLSRLKRATDRAVIQQSSSDQGRSYYNTLLLCILSSIYREIQAGLNLPIDKFAHAVYRNMVT
jgi:hypothetical protein